MTDQTHPIKAPSDILAEDVICQSFIQSSSTLAYACLLIRQRKYDLAVHVLHSLEAKQATRFKDMVFYLQAQIGIETRDFAAVKRRLAPRAQQHPNDMVSLSLLQSCIYQEWAEAQQSLPAPQAAAPGAGAAEPAPRPPAAPEPAAGPGVPPASASAPVPAEVPSASRPSAAAPRAQEVPILKEGDFAPYVTVVGDENTLALALWNPTQRRFHATCRDPELEPLVGMLPQIVPEIMAPACKALEGGDVLKICFCFQDLTITSLHGAREHLGLVTGDLSHSLLTMVRAENIFARHASVGLQSRAMELTSNE